MPISLNKDGGHGESNLHRGRLFITSTVALGLLVAIIAWAILRNDVDPVRAGDIILKGAVKDRAIETESQYTESADLTSFEDLLTPLATSWRPHVIDEDNLATEQQESLLLEVLAQHVSVRAQSTPDAFFELAQNSPEYRWVEQQSDRNGPLLGSVYRYHAQRELESGTTTDNVRAFWRDVLVAHQFVLKSVGISDLGVRCVIRQIRIADYDRSLGLSGDDSSYWAGFGATAYMIPILVPKQSLEEILETQNSVVIADCHIILQSQNDRLMNWITTWRWDATLQKWVCIEARFKFSRATVAFF